MTNATGAVVWSAAYTPLGKAEVAGSSTQTNNFRFPGQYYDQESGLHYNWHRYYDPKTGRYLTADPIGLEKGFNHLYNYALNNPIGMIDPTGLLPREDAERFVRYMEVSLCQNKATYVEICIIACENRLKPLCPDKYKQPVLGVICEKGAFYMCKRICEAAYDLAKRIF